MPPPSRQPQFIWSARGRECERPSSCGARFTHRGNEARQQRLAAHLLGQPATGVCRVDVARREQVRVPKFDETNDAVQIVSGYGYGAGTGTQSNK